MDISAAAATTNGLKFNAQSTPAVDYNPPPNQEGITPSRDAIVAETRAAQIADPRGQNLDIFA